MLCNISAFLVSVGHIPWHGESGPAGKGKKICMHTSWGHSTEYCKLLSALSFKDKECIFALFVFWYSTMHSSAVCQLRETCWMATRSCYFICEQQCVPTTASAYQNCISLVSFLSLTQSALTQLLLFLLAKYRCQSQKNFLQVKFAVKSILV